MNVEHDTTRLASLLMLAACLGAVLTLNSASGADAPTATKAPVRHAFSVLDYGAKGDGTTLDTEA
ncbi:exported hypothetical protein [Verrucomicrobia bacterium]|nr:exported hypothetical protein [Verrucomicrobiota bacterium]